MWSASSELGCLFCETFDCLNLVQLVSVPTDIKGNVLDLIATTSPEIIGNNFVEPSAKILAISCLFQHNLQHTHCDQ